MAETQLILIKHASPLVDPGRPSDQWNLSERGRASCDLLAIKLATHRPTAIVSSEEPKARQTAELISRKLEVPFETAPGLHEHDRSNVAHMRSGEFISMIELLLRKPDVLVLGRETASAALKRFENAVAGVVKSHPDANLAIVAHGTVIALFLEARGAGKAFDLWRRLGLPSFAVMGLPDMQVQTVVEKIQ